MSNRATQVAQAANQLLRPIVTYGMLLGVLFGFFSGKIDIVAFMAVAAPVINFWFGTQRQERRASDDGNGANGQEPRPPRADPS